MKPLFQIPIYEDERDIAESIIKSSVISSLAEVTEATPFDVPENLNKLCASERKSFDLYYLNALLFSSLWNDNDELFLPSETWYARNTVTDKPFNFEHECDDIIGHTTSSFTIDGDSNKITDDIKVDELPSLIHVISQAVLYKCWSKADKQERMDKILQEIPDGKWFVSVECLFPDFDYALKDKDGQYKIIARNQKTSFLTKYLRLFNGTGVYDGCRIARVPRNFIISGKGLVKRPANKNSIIFANKIDYKKFNNKIVLNTNNEIAKASVYINTENTEVNKMDNALEQKYQVEIKEWAEKYNKLQASIAEDAASKTKAVLDESKKVLEAKEQEINVLKASVQDFNAKNTELVKSVEQLVKEKLEVDKQIAVITENAKKQDRLMAAKTKLKLDDVKAVEFVNNLDKLSDEAFQKHVEFQLSFVGSTNSQTTVVEKPSLDTEATKKALEAAKGDSGVTVIETNAAEDLKQLQAKVAEYISLNHVKEGKSKFAVEVKK